jgi:hypothetical protein
LSTIVVSCGPPENVVSEKLPFEAIEVWPRLLSAVSDEGVMPDPAGSTTVPLCEAVGSDSEAGCPVDAAVGCVPGDAELFEP